MNTAVKLWHIIWNIWQKIPKSVRFILVGGFNTAVGYLCFVGLYTIGKTVAPTIAILAMSYGISITVSFITLKIFVFQTTSWTWMEYRRIVETYIGILVLNGFLLWVSEKIGLNIPIAQGVLVILLTVITYLTHKYYGFKDG